MYERLLYLYKEKKINEDQLNIAISKGWISDEQKNSIISSNSIS